MGALIGMGDPTRYLLGVHICAPNIAKDGHIDRHTAGHAIARLLDALAEVNRAAINSGGRTGFEAALRQLQFF